MNSRCALTGRPCRTAPLDQPGTRFTYPEPLDLSTYAGQTVDVEFHLHSVGDTNAAFEIDDIMLAESTAIGPQIGVADDLGDFGDLSAPFPQTALGIRSELATYSLASSGDATLHVTNFSIGGSHPDDFVAILKDAAGTVHDLRSATLDVAVAMY